MSLGTLAVVIRPAPSRWTGRDNQLSSGDTPNPPAIQQLAQAASGDFLTFHTLYTLCGHSTQIRQQLSGTLDPVRLELHYSGWTLQKHSGGFCLTRSIDQFCPKHILVRRESGHLYLYQNKEDNGLLTRIALLPDPVHGSHGEQIAHELEEGVVFDNLEAWERYLESLNS